MSKLYVASEFKSVSGDIHIQCDDLVGTGRNWIEPARVLGIQPTELIMKLKTEYNAHITPYRKDGKINFIGYSWSNLADARRFKNYLNKIAREKNYMI
jgi:hypothetical protein